MILPARRLLVALSLWWLAACATTPPLRYYLLVPQIEAAKATDPSIEKLSIGVGPIEIPDYLDRAEIVIRRGSTRLVLGDTDKWGEPFDPLFGRVLVENLGRQLGSRNIQLLPQRRDSRLDAQMELDLLRFDADEGGSVVLDLRWRLYDRDGGRLLATDRLTLLEPVAWPGGLDTGAARFEAVVAGMNRAMVSLAAELGGILKARLARR